ncbi:MAG TPA: twin-arginine translocation signal domain-containing protein [Micromonosporaceae bacterium]|nr:twin-arginine translocation signal domain-containing protein [Micromonosporaceae bacterium]
MSPVSRRTVLKGTVVAGAGAALPAGVAGMVSAQATALAAPSADPKDPTEIRWLEGGVPTETVGTTWGVPWPRGKVAPTQTFAMRTADGKDLPLQSWPLGYWPDGSLKWSAHAVPGDAPKAERYTLIGGTPAAPARAVTVTEKSKLITVDTGVVVTTIRTSGEGMIESVVRNGRQTANNGRLIVLRQDGVDDEDEGKPKHEQFTSEVKKVTVEQRGPVRAVIKVEGMHRARHGSREWLPFTVRLYFYAGGESFRMVHTFIFDGQENKDFIRGIGVRFDVPMTDELYNRHVRLAGTGDGVLAEAVQGLTALRRDPGAAVRSAQIAGQRTPDISTWPTTVNTRVQYIPAYGDYKLTQLSANGFTIEKRTKSGSSWIQAGAGTRASGHGYVGGASGGFGGGLRNFWQLHPTQLDIRGAATDRAEYTVWLWSPDAKPMDLRFYHDGMGQDTYPKQLEGLNITYEDYEPGFGTPYGVARTNELMFWALDATPTRERFAAQAAVVRTPPLLVTPPERTHAAGVFGDWAPVDRSTPAKAQIEDRLDLLFTYYRKQVDQRSWYGFWNYGDIMHSYDPDRHEWRYDIGGFGWDNSELSPDLWLWYSYLRTGRADIFRFAEAMTRHTGEVDVYHLGRFTDLGTRHNVLHWGDSAKQLRISTAIYRRFFYFLTADERVGDLMHDLIDADKTFLALDPLRKIRTEPYTPDPKALAVGLGTDWSGLAAAWFTEWERGGDPIAKTKLLNTATAIGQMKFGFFTDDSRYDITTGTMTTDTVKVNRSHLSALFGLPEICSELIAAMDLPDFKRAWLQYCTLYNAPREQQTAVLGMSWAPNQVQPHSRITAYAAVALGDDALAARAWAEFNDGGWVGYKRTDAWNVIQVTPPTTLNPIDEGAWISTNDTSQYGLAAIQCLALIGDKIPT